MARSAIAWSWGMAAIPWRAGAVPGRASAGPAKDPRVGDGPITVRGLLTHSAGLPREPDDPYRSAEHTFVRIRDDDGSPGETFEFEVADDGTVTRYRRHSDWYVKVR